MKNLILLVLLLFFVISPIYGYAAENYSCPSVVHIINNSPAINYGESTILPPVGEFKSASDYFSRFLVQCGVPTYRNDDIIDAKLFLFQPTGGYDIPSGSSVEIELRKMNTTWLEGTGDNNGDPIATANGATWNYSSNGVEWSSIGADYGDVMSSVEFQAATADADDNQFHNFTINLDYINDIYDGTKSDTGFLLKSLEDVLTEGAYINFRTDNLTNPPLLQLDFGFDNKNNASTNITCLEATHMINRTNSGDQRTYVNGEVNTVVNVGERTASGQVYNTRMLIRCNMSSAVGYKIKSAKLFLYVQDDIDVPFGGDTVIRLYNTSNQWNEDKKSTIGAANTADLNGSTWYEYCYGDNAWTGLAVCDWSTQGGDLSTEQDSLTILYADITASKNQWYPFNLDREMVTGWINNETINYGMILKSDEDDGEGSYVEFATDNLTGFEPKIEITFTESTQPSFAGLTNNGSTTSTNQSKVNWSVTTTDNSQLSESIFSCVNCSIANGVWVNETSESISGMSYFINITKTIGVKKGTLVCGNIYVNDTSGNINESGESCFTVANSAPTTPTLTYPADTTSFEVNWVFLNFTATDADSDILRFYVWADTTADPTTLIFNGTNNFFNYTSVSDGTYNWKAAVDDGTVNSSNSSSISFTISTTAPSINLNTPTNNQYLLSSSVEFNFTATDVGGVDVCSLYTNVSGSWGINQTLTSVSSGVKTNFTPIILDEGSYNWNVECNDTSDNRGFSGANRTAHVDLTIPLLTVSSPTQDLSTEDKTIDLTISATDLFLNTCSFSIFRSTSTLIETNDSVSCVGTSVIDLSAFSGQEFRLVVNASDLASRLNSTEINFTTTDPVNDTGGGGGGGGSEAIEQLTEQLQDISGQAICGNNACEEGETSLNCFRDCQLNPDTILFCFKLLNYVPLLDKLYVPSEECRWEDAWFLIGLAVATMVVVGFSGGKNNKTFQKLKKQFR